MKKYKKHYEMQAEVKENGKIDHKIVYKGQYYCYQCDEMRLKNMKRIFVGILGILSVILVGMGLINNPGSRRFEITIPYVCCYLPLVYAWLGLFRIIIAPKRMSYVDYDKGYVRLRKSTVGLFVFSVLIMVGELLFWILGKEKFSLHSEWLFLMGGLFFSLILLAFLRIQHCFPCISEKKI